MWLLLRSFLGRESLLETSRASIPERLYQRLDSMYHNVYEIRVCAYLTRSPAVPLTVIVCPGTLCLYLVDMAAWHNILLLCIVATHHSGTKHNGHLVVRHSFFRRLSCVALPVL